MDKLKKLAEALKGKRTYILAAIGGLVVALKLAGVLDDATANTVLTLLGFGSFAALRAAK